MPEFSILDPSTWASSQASDPAAGFKNSLMGWTPPQEPASAPDPVAPLGNAVINGVEDRSLPFPEVLKVSTPEEIRQTHLQQIQEALTNPDMMAALTLSRDRGNGLGADNQFLNDSDILNPIEFMQKHGSDIYNLMTAFRSRGHGVRERGNREITTAEHISNFAVQTLAGANQAGLALAQIPARALTVPNSPVQDWVLSQLEAASAASSTSSQNLQSPSLRDHNYINSIKAYIDDLDNQAAFDTDRSDDTNFDDALASHGRYILNQAGSMGRRILEDPNMIASITAQGVGSLLVGGPSSKVLSSAAKTLNGTVAQRSLGSVGMRARDEAIDQVTFPMTTAALGGGAAAGQASQDVMGMTLEELANNPRHNELVASGMSPEEAQRRMATQAGTAAIPLAAVVGAATGKLVEKIELAPFKSGFGSPATLAVNALRETTEEGIQEGTEQFSSNLGVALSGADPDKQLLADVGTSIVEGAVGGAGSVGVLQGPGAALKLAASSVAAPFKFTFGAIANRGARIVQAASDISSVSRKNMTTSVAKAADSAKVVVEQLRKLAREHDQVGPDFEAYIQRVQEASQVRESDLEIMPEVLLDQMVLAAQALGRMPNRFEALDIAAGLAANEEASTDDRTAAATFILKNITANEKLFTEDLPGFLKNVPHDREEYQNFERYAGILDAIRQVPSIAEAMEWALNTMQQADRDLSSVDLSTPAGQKIVAQTVDMATLAPQAVNPNVADQILNQDKKDKSRLTPTQRRILKAASDLKKAEAAYEETVAEEGATGQENLGFVNRQIKVDGGAKDHQLSLAQHTQGIAEALEAGNKGLVKERVGRLVAFAKSHRNKVAAANRSIANGDGQNVSYTAADRDGKSFKNIKGWGVVVGSPGSERAYRIIHAEATALANLSNSFAELYPELEIDRVEVPPIALKDEKRGDPVKVKSPAQSLATTTETGGDSTKSTESPPTPKPTESRTSDDASQDTAKAATAEVVSRITPDQAKLLSDSGLNDRLNRIDDKLVDRTATAEDRATYKVLDAEMTRREDIAAETQAKEVEITRRVEVEEIFRLLMSAGWKNRAELDEWSDKLDTFSDDDFIDAYEKSEHFKVVISDLKGKVGSLVPKILQDISATIGLKDLSRLVRMVKAVYLRDDDRRKSGGYFLAAGPAIFINETWVEILNINTNRSYGESELKHVLKHIIAHELGHAIDFHASRDGGRIYASTGEYLDAPVFYRDDDNFGRWYSPFSQEGDLWKEFQGLEHNPLNTAYQPFFTYVKDQPTEERQASEFFAELTAFVINNPSLARQLIPNGTKAFEGILARAAANRGIGEARLGDTLTTDGGIHEGAQATDPVVEVTPEKITDQTDAVPTDAEVIKLIEEYDDTTPSTRLTTAEVFPNLVGARNFFHLAFNMPKKMKSRMHTVLAPIRNFFDALSSPEDLQNFVGREIEVSEQDLAAIQELVAMGGDVRGVMLKRLNSLVGGTRKYDDGRELSSIKDLLTGGTEVHKYRRYRILNILEKTDKGYQYNQSLLETAIIAGLDWALNAAARTVPVEKSDIAAILEIDESQVSDAVYIEFNDGMSLDTAVRTMAETIRKFWGVEANPDTVQDYVEGIPEAVAKEILFGLAEQGLLQLGIKFDKENDSRMTFPSLSSKTFNRVWMSRDRRPDDINDLVDRLHGVSNIFSDMALIEPEIEAYAYEPVTTVDKTQLHNDMVPTTDQQNQAQLNVQAAPYYPNELMFSFIAAMGREAFVTLMSGYPYKDGDLKKSHTAMRYNKVHWESVKGLQRSLVSSFDGVSKQMAQLKKHAEGLRKEALKNPNVRRGDIPQLSDTAMFFRYHVNKLGRLQMAGMTNVQVDKLARHIFIPTRSTLDVSVRGTPDFRLFTLMVGQGIGLSTTRENIPGVIQGGRRVIEQQVIAETMTEGGKYRPLVERLKAWVQSRDTGQETGHSVEFMDFLTGIQHTTETSLSIHGMLSLVEVARYELAAETGQDLTKFESMNYAEADGKTNGMANALLLYGTGPITREYLVNAGKVGAYFGRVGKTLNDHMAEDPKDLYQTGADVTVENVVQLGQRIKKSNAKAYQTFTTFQRILSALDVNVSTDPETGNITIKRGTLKNPMTITIYGSGAKGIAGNVTSELLGVMYEAITEMIRSTDNDKGEGFIYGADSEFSFRDDLLEVTSNIVLQNGETLEYFVKRQGESKDLKIEGKAINLELTPQQFENFRQNTRMFLVDPMREAIESTVTSHVSTVTTALQEMAQIQSIFAKAMFIRLITERLAMKQADPERYNYTKGEFLSRNELAAIFKRVLAYAPMISTGTQNYYLAGGKKSDLFEKTKINVGGEEIEVVFPKTFSLALSGNMETNVFVSGPTLSGVKVIPTLVVGSGEGQMQLSFLSGNPEEAKKVLPVFDGLNMPGDKIDAYSRLINKAVHDTWTTTKNPVRAALESFQAFMSRDPVSTLFAGGQIDNDWQVQARKEITQVIENLPRITSGQEIVDDASAQQFMTSLMERMAVLADQTDARRLTYAEFPMSVDQMATGEASYVNLGNPEVFDVDKFPEADHADISDAMTARYWFHLANIQGREVVPTLVTTAKKMIQNVSKVTPKSGQSLAEINQRIRQVEKELNGLEVHLDNPKNSWSILRGYMDTRDELSATLWNLEDQREVLTKGLGVANSPDENPKWREFVKNMAAVTSGETSQVALIDANHKGSMARLSAMLKLGATNTTQREMAQAATKALVGTGYRIVFGSSAMLDAWEQENNANRFFPGSNSEMGKIDPVAKVILISNMEVDTVIHELIHAATIDKVRAFYADPNLLSKEEREAVTRLEGLMDEWRSQDPLGETFEGNEARGIAEAEIERRLDKGQKAEALNEFMAWVLSNQHLATLAQKTKVKNPLWRIVGDALTALKSLIWGGPKKGPRVGDSILSNLRFNTRVLMSGPTRIEKFKQDSATVALFQSRAFGSSDRISEMRSRLHNRIIAWIEGDGGPIAQVRADIRRPEIADARKLAQQLTTTFAWYFEDIDTMQAKSTFETVQLALMTEIDLNSNALSRMEDLYTHVMGQLKPSHFLQNPDIVSTDPNDPDMYQARKKLDVILGNVLTITDKKGRSSLLSSFLALAMTSEQFRGVLAGLDKPKSDERTAKGLDGVLENTANKILDGLGARIAGETGKDRNVRDALDSLMEAMIENVGDQRSHIGRKLENGFERFETGVADQIQDKSARIAEKSSDIARKSKLRVVKAGADAVSFVATMINEQKATDAALGMNSWFNKHEGWESTRALIGDLIGRTRENAPVFEMISKVRQLVQQWRQQFRDELPKILNDKFKTPLSKAQQTATYKTLAQTDIAAVAAHYGLDIALDMVANDQRRSKEIKTLENTLSQSAIDKAKQLARYMVTGDYGVMLLSNAYVIAVRSTSTTINMRPDPKIVDAIDRLVSLYAIDEIDPGTRDLVSDLIQNEQIGIEFVTSYLMGQRVDEMAKVAASGKARINHFKGDIPSEAKKGGSLIIASDGKRGELEMRGYTRVADYVGSSADRLLGKRGYYYAPVSARAPFSQGVMQTVHQTASGVDPATGFMTDTITAGRIEDPRQIQLIEQSLGNQRQTSENLRPVFHEITGKIVAFERTASPGELSRLNRSTDLTAMIGVWRGRQAEEMMAKEVNKELLGKLHDIWKRDEKKGLQAGYVNILDPGLKDKIIVEAAKLIPREALDQAAELFGPDTLMVRRDMILDAVGARQASVGDLFTGQTRWNPKYIKDFEKIAVGMFGKKIYPFLVGTEKNVQEVVTNVKVMIVVKSVIVPAANMMWNIFQLINRGIPMKAVIHGIGAKTAEINSYIKRRKREIDLEADLRAAHGKGDFILARQIQVKIQSIQDSYKRMSIWPLIEAGEFSAISNGQVTAEDLSLADGKWTDFVERKVNELKEPLRTTVRYGLITRDTALFQGLGRAVQYGDFIAKAVLYDDLVNRKKVSSKEALATVNEAFVNYNRNAGRGRQYLESVGLLWFYNYKLRIMKEAAYLLRHHPLRSLMMTMVPPMPGIGELGSPLSDGIMSVVADGRWWHSIGPGMAFGGWQLHPWINLAR